MLFHSLEFALFLPALLLLDWFGAVLLPPTVSWRVRRALYLLASYGFYAAWEWQYCGLLLLSTAVDYWIGLRLGVEERAARRRWLLTTSLVVNLGMLSLFKYYNFFRATVVDAGLSPDVLPVSEFLLPVGISFFTFQTLSYTIDVYRRRIPTERSITDFGLYVAFFPQLVAGPIVRARDFLWQLRHPKQPRLARVLAGLERFVIGLFKKTVIADNLTRITDPVFADPGAYGATTNAFALLCWGIVIYADFAGYSDMAIGVARMLGFKFAENFKFPYLARSIGDFWRRWHISLSSWLRDYLYIPLGGSRHGLSRAMAAISITMLLGGLWHGASWNFVLWGAWWGGWIALGHLWRRVPGSERLLPGPVSWFGTQLIAFLGWVPFRCADFATTQVMLGKLFSQELLTDLAAGRWLDIVDLRVGPADLRIGLLALVIVLVTHAVAFFTGGDRLEPASRPVWAQRWVRSWLGTRVPLLRGVALAASFVITVVLGYVHSAQFVYFQF